MTDVIGIDPGMKGGFAYISTNYQHIEVFAMPLLPGGKYLDMKAIIDWIRSRCYDSNPTMPVVVIEKITAMPGQGVVSTGKFHFVTGVIWGIVATIGCPFREVRPQDWKKVVLEGTLKDKAAAIQYCSNMYSGVSLLATPRSKVPSDGLADALCIATYAWLSYVQ